MGLWVATVLGLAVVVAYVRGGRLRHLADIDLQWWWLLFAGFSMQTGAELLPDERSWSRAVGVGLILASYVPLVVLAYVNRTRPGMALAGVGMALNFAVIAINGGMPVLPAAVDLVGGSLPLQLDAKHVLLDDTSILIFLADIIPLRWLGQVLSIGDVLLAVGLAQFLEHELRRPEPWFRR
ncbi:MAG: DUF5317 domain-containing protein [Acidimicrobiia bacterium]